LLRYGRAAAWNAWRDKNPYIRPDLSKVHLIVANLSGANLRGADLREADFSGAVSGLGAGADLSGADLSGANLSWANLSGANLSGADLQHSTLVGTDFTGGDLSGCRMYWAHLIQANLTEADLTHAQLTKTIFVASQPTNVQGLDRCDHPGPSMIDFITLKLSDPLPVAFLRGVGLPDNLIDYLPSLLNKAIQHYSCLISYSSKDQDFAERLHADLQNKGVRCWFAPHDMPIGAKIIDALDEAIRLRDKVLLILSKGAIASDWVEGEVTRALDEERARKQIVLFPVRLDDAVMQTTEGWARLLRGQRNIGDFSGWKDHSSG
jgi:hypothetical protein